MEKISNKYDINIDLDLAYSKICIPLKRFEFYLIHDQQDIKIVIIKTQPL